MNNGWWKGYLTGVAVCALSIFTACIIAPSTDYRGQAIEKGFAEYNQSTGDWQWKEAKR